MFSTLYLGTALLINRGGYFHFFQETFIVNKGSSLKINIYWKSNLPVVTKIISQETSQFVICWFLFLKTGWKINLLFPDSGGVWNFSCKSCINLIIGLRNLLLHLLIGLLNSSEPHSRLLSLNAGLTHRSLSSRDVLKSL